MIGKKLKDVMINEGLTQEDLAKLINSDRSIISRWLKGERKPSAKNLKKISEVLNIPVSFFLNKNFSIKNDCDKTLKLKIADMEKRLIFNEKEIKLLKKENEVLKNKFKSLEKRECK